MTNIFQGKRNKNIFTNILKNICTQEYIRRKGGSTAGSDSKNSVGILLILLQFSQ